MNRIEHTFRELGKKGRKAFIPYVTFGDPDIKTSKKIVRALSEAGADIIELGIPFSDPLADGPTIQRAIHRSLDAGCTVRGVFNAVKELREDVETPFVFMTYYNILVRYGIRRFVRDAVKNGADGLIVPDLPMEEADELMRETRGKDFSLVLLAAPTTPQERFKNIARVSGGFVYYVSLTGVTGARKVVSDRLVRELSRLKKLTVKPICVGFGISRPAHARKIARYSDGVIVGSAIIDVIEKNLSSKKNIAGKVKNFASSIARAVHGARS